MVCERWDVRMSERRRRRYAGARPVGGGVEDGDRVRSALDRRGSVTLEAGGFKLLDGDSGEGDTGTGGLGRI